MGIVFGRTGAPAPDTKVILAGAGYPSFFVAEVGGANENAQFQILANYIGVFGDPKNRKTQPLAMTAPVITAPQRLEMTAPVLSSFKDGSAGRVMQFVLPFEIQTREDVPEPTDEAVTIKHVPERVLGVRAFSGYSTDRNVSENLQQLLTLLHAEGFTASEEKSENQWELAQYHPPFTLPFFRLNEIWVHIDPNNQKLLSLQS